MGDLRVEAVQGIGGFEMGAVEGEEVAVSGGAGAHDESMVVKGLDAIKLVGKVEGLAVTAGEEDGTTFLGFEVEAFDLDRAAFRVDFKGFALDDGEVEALVAREAGLDGDEGVFMLDETAFDEGSWGADVPVDVC